MRIDSTIYASTLDTAIVSHFKNVAALAHNCLVVIVGEQNSQGIRSAQRMTHALIFALPYDART